MNLRVFSIILVLLVFNMVVCAQTDCLANSKVFVRDAEGKPITNATLKVFQVQPENKVVFAFDLVPRGGEEYFLPSQLARMTGKDRKPFPVDGQYQLEIMAAGFEVRTLNYSIPGCLRESMTVVLTPVTKIETSVLVSGSVFDDAGAVVPGVIITFRDKNRKETTARTTDDGKYEVKLETGNYSIRSGSAPGFADADISKFRVAPLYKGKMNLDLVLEVTSEIDHHFVVGMPVKNEQGADKNKKDNN